jgi:hypothetical protein
MLWCFLHNDTKVLFWFTLILWINQCFLDVSWGLFSCCFDAVDSMLISIYVVHVFLLLLDSRMHTSNNWLPSDIYIYIYIYILEFMFAFNRRVRRHSFTYVVFSGCPVLLSWLWSKLWRIWLRHCTTNRKVAGSFEFFIGVILPVALWAQDRLRF